MSIAYFVQELADPAVRKRVEMLRAGGQSVKLLGFERMRDGAAPPADGRVLGRTHNRRFLSRMLSVLAAVPRALAARDDWRAADLVIARNLEMLALVVMITQLAGARPRIAYECLDIHRLMLGRNPVSALLRAIERACLRRAAVVITSSTAFERRYFRERQRYAGPVVIAENKVFASSMPPQAVLERGPPWVIAWCGVLRCARSFALLRQTAEAHPGLLRVELWGIPALDQIPDFHAAVAASPYLEFRGRYRAEDLSAIYANAHFAWAVDFYEAGGNSDWLLPNRLYESLCFGSVPIAAAGVETARWLNAHQVGVVIETPLEQALERFLLHLDEPGYRLLREAAVGLEPGVTRYTEEACRDFVASLAGAPA